MLCAVKTSRAPDAAIRGQPVERLPDVIGVGLDEPGMLVPVADVGDFGRRDARSRPARRARRGRSRGTAGTRVAALGRRQDADRAAHAGARHLLERVGQETDASCASRRGRAAAGRARAARASSAARLRQRQLGERRHAAEQLVVVRDFVDPFGAHAPAAQHVLEKRPHIVGPLRPAERDQRARHRTAVAIVDRIIRRPVALPESHGALRHRPRGQSTRSVRALAPGVAARVGELLHRHGQRDGLSAAAAVPDARARRGRDVARGDRRRRRRARTASSRSSPAGSPIAPGSRRSSCSPATACRRSSVR